MWRSGLNLEQHAYREGVMDALEILKELMGEDEGVSLEEAIIEIEQALLSEPEEMN